MAEPKALDPRLSDPSPAATVLQLMTGYWVSQAIYVAAKLGLAPCKPEVREVATWDLVNVEAIPFDVLSAGVSPRA